MPTNIFLCFHARLQMSLNHNVCRDHVYLMMSFPIDTPVAQSNNFSDADSMLFFSLYMSPFLMSIQASIQGCITPLLHLPPQSFEGVLVIPCDVVLLAQLRPLAQIAMLLHLLNLHQQTVQLAQG